jgi:hypothetical protein
MGSTAKALEAAWAPTAMPSLGTLPRLVQRVAAPCRDPLPPAHDLAAAALARMLAIACW